MFISSALVNKVVYNDLLFFQYQSEINKITNILYMHCGEGQDKMKAHFLRAINVLLKYAEHFANNRVQIICLAEYLC